MGNKQAEAVCVHEQVPAQARACAGACVAIVDAIACEARAEFSITETKIYYFRPR